MYDYAENKIASTPLPEPTPAHPILQVLNIIFQLNNIPLHYRDCPTAFKNSKKTCANTLEPAQ